MGQKVNPHGLRVGVIKGWDSQWYANKKNFGKNLKEDNDIRKHITKNYADAAISRIVIERAANVLTVEMYCGRPGIAIGKAAENVEKMKKEIALIVNGKPSRRNNEIAKIINVNVHEVKRVDIDATLVAENIAHQLERRIQFRRAMKQAMSRAMKSGAKGIKTMVSGRLDGAEIARCEQYHEGSIPLQTLRANIDYGTANAHTTYGVIGVKVWIYKGEVFNQNLTDNKGGQD